MDSFIIHEGEGPFIATAIHDGHNLRNDLKDVVNLDDSERLREEDPFTGSWIDISDTWIKVMDSRFEIDLNRSREKTIYRTPEDAWGLQVWKKELSEVQLNESLQKYDHFYNALKRLLDHKLEKYGGFLVYDLHTYNYRRGGAHKEPAAAKMNPDINIGTGNMDRKKWVAVIDSFIHEMSSFDYMSRKLDVRENIKFQGGHFLRWIHSNYPDVSCVLAIEVKKIFMNEWTGKPDHNQVHMIKEALRATIPSVMKNFKNIIGS